MQLSTETRIGRFVAKTNVYAKRSAALQYSVSAGFQGKGQQDIAGHAAPLAIARTYEQHASGDNRPAGIECATRATDGVNSREVASSVIVPEEFAVFCRVGAEM